MKDFLQKQIDTNISDLNESKNRMSVIEESLMNAKKSMSTMRNRVGTVV